MNTMIPIVLVSGPVGVGKSVVGGEVAEILERNGTPHSFVDFDQIRFTFPRPADDPWGNRLGFENLGAIWRNCSRYGSLNLIISDVVEDESFLGTLKQTIPEGDVSTIQLSASLDTLEARLRKREIGSGLDWHLNRAGELLDSLAQPGTPSDHRIATDSRTVVEIAEEVVSKIAWRLN
jgi:hypothetical protein